MSISILSYQIVIPTIHENGEIHTLIDHIHESLDLIIGDFDVDPLISLD
jgi:hypothetical protein